MATTEAIHGAPRRFSPRLPRPLWIALTATAMILVGICFRIGIPIYRQQVATQEILARGGWMTSGNMVPRWLEDLIGSEHTWLFEEPRDVNLRGPQVTDDTLRLLHDLPTMTTLWLEDTQVSDAAVDELPEKFPHLQIMKFSSIISEFD